jgi:AraC-like DNA-binding protein
VRAISRLLACAEQAGLEREYLVAAAGLRADDLSDPDARLPFSIEIALWQLIARDLNDPGFGVRAGASLDIRDAGLLGYIMANSATLGAALQRLVRYNRVLSEAIAFEFEPTSRPQVSIAETVTAFGADMQLAVDFRLATALSAARQLTGVDLVPLQISVSYAQPSSIFEHRRFFRCPIRFARPATRVLFHERELALPIARSDEVVAGYLSAYAEQMLRSLVDGTSVRERVRAALWASLSDGRPDLAQIASVVGMSARTLQRRLAEEGTSLQGELDVIRRGMALAALRSDDAPVQDIAFLLGYTETSTFHRAFRRWTGTTPDQYRRRLRARGP